MVNGGDVKELMNGGTSIVPDLDSIAEFRVLTNNFDAEYGNYSGGIVNVVTKSGDQRVARQRLRVPAKHRSRRAQFLFAGPQLLPAKSVRRHGRRPHQEGQDLLLRRLPGNADQPGHRHRADFRSLAGRACRAISGRGESLTGDGERRALTRFGDHVWQYRSESSGYAVSANEPYYTPGCVSTASASFPNAIIPQRVWSSPAQHLLQYIPLPNIGPSTFSTGAQGETVRDDKGSFRVDAN